MSQSVNAIPQADPANGGSLPGLIDEALKRFKINLEDCMPASVVTYDHVANVAVIQPSIKMVTSDGILLSRGALASIPVFTLGGGGFLIRFPLVAGSRGWIKATDRDISLYLQAQTGAETHPNTARLHSFSDGVFIPDVMADFILNSEDVNHMTIQNKTGTIRIALAPDRIRVTSPLFQIDSATIQFTTAPNVGALTPWP